MRTTSKLGLLGVYLSLQLLCSCSTATPNQPQLPADVRMNKDAGRGGGLTVTLRLESGEAVPVIIDTGCAVTVFDKSLERKLGKRLDSFAGRASFGYNYEAGAYPAPKLYWRSTPLMMTGTNVLTVDFEHWPQLKGCPIASNWILRPTKSAFWTTNARTKNSGANHFP